MVFRLTNQITAVWVGTITLKNEEELIKQWKTFQIQRLQARLACLFSSRQVYYHRMAAAVLNFTDRSQNDAVEENSLNSETENSESDLNKN